MYTYPYPRPSVAGDTVVFAPLASELHVLLIRRKNPPFQGSWALPGGFLEETETTEQCAARELLEETGIVINTPQLIGIFSNPDRDPRGRVISAAYYALTCMQTPQANDDAAEAKWHSVRKLPSIAFDHKLIISCALEKLRTYAAYHPVGMELLPEYFHFSELQALYEAIFDKRIIARTLKRKLRKYNFIVRATETLTSLKSPSQLFRFDPEQYLFYCRNTFFLDLNEKE